MREDRFNNNNKAEAGDNIIRNVLFIASGNVDLLIPSILVHLLFEMIAPNNISEHLSLFLSINALFVI